MAKFVLIYSGGGSDMPSSEADRAAVMQAWGAWFESLGADGVVDPGNPFGPAAKNIASDGTVSDGPVGNPPANGYSIISAASLEAAVKSAQGCPILKDGGQISVYEVFPVM